MIRKKWSSVPRCSLRYFSSVLEKREAKAKRQQEKELRQLEKLQNTTTQKEIKTDLSHAEYKCETESGAKKDVTCQLPSTYSSKFVEACWYEWWEKEGYFKPSKSRRNEDVFSLVIPPPNVTGKLHLGHALTVALEDVLCRWNRMRGKEVVWIPGCDHAGIATQAVVEKLLETKNTTRKDLGREKFVQEVWNWKDRKEEEIYDQLRVLGSSLDWTRTNFTLSPKFCHAVREAFIRLHEKDIIYRKKSLINWSCQLQSTISDIEIDNKQLEKPTMISVPGYRKKMEFGVLHTFDYPLVNPTTERNAISVSTTRIETMLGDTAIAVNPDDPRYSILIGSFVQHPLLPDMVLPIIADSYVDKNFGTGAVKITPAHDFRDFEIGSRHGLPSRIILDDQGNITNTGNPDFDNLPRFEAREKVIKSLDQAGLYKGKTSHEMTLPICSRSGDVVEPRIKTQWFVRIQDLSQQAIEAVQTGQIQIVPNSYLASWYNWLSESEDWCISRQLWWGHRIPAYKVSTHTGESMWISAHTELEVKSKAEKIFGETGKLLTITQDDDVLDTWFSSALFPFVCFGWPENNPDLEKYYPLSLMETGYDLLFFWVARMAMMGIALTGKVPFNTVYLHNMVRDSQGRKMSKSLGNVIDPLQVIYGCSPQELDERIKMSNLSKKEEKYALKDRAKTLPHGIPECGTDALRFYLCFNKSTGKDISLDIHTVVQYRYFCNKIWNVFKFLLKNVRKHKTSEDTNIHVLRPVDHWIRSKFSAATHITNTGLDSLNFSSASSIIHKFFFVDLADFYLESCKPVFSNDSSSAERVAIEKNFEFIFESFLRLLSPFMPYITEELWQRLPNKSENYQSIMIAGYPTEESHNFRNIQLENEMGNVRDAIQLIRNIRQTFHVPTSALTNISISCQNEDDHAFSSNVEVIKSLTKSCDIKIFNNGVDELPGFVSNNIRNTNIQVSVQLKGLIDIETELMSLRQKESLLKKELFDLEEKQKNIDKQQSLKKIQDKICKVKQSLLDLQNMISTLN
uniref:valine--tRNA ligase-like isoform X1 n=1 Tax=Styela clava TaxID=7725 RepID=UPI0019392C1F|nr:valine--tRNA ligase-like isoform X1 [Styela clava]